MWIGVIVITATITSCVTIITTTPAVTAGDHCRATAGRSPSGAGSAPAARLRASRSGSGRSRTHRTTAASP